MREPHTLNPADGILRAYSNYPSAWLRDVIAGHAPVAPDPGNAHHDVAFRKQYAAILLRERGGN